MERRSNMEFIDRYNQLCDKVGAKKYYITSINFGDLDTDYKVCKYSSVRELFEDYRYKNEYDDYDLSFKDWYKKRVSCENSDIEYRYPLFDNNKLFYIVKALISCGFQLKIGSTILDEYDINLEYVNGEVYYHEQIAKTLEEAIISLLLRIEDVNGLYDKLREILSTFNQYEEQKAHDDKIYNQVYIGIDEEEYEEV